MAEDISPALLEKIQRSFQAAFDRDAQIQAVYRAIEAGTATYAQANEFAIRAGELLAEAFGAHLSSAVLPDGRMYYNIAQSVLTPTFRRNYELITGVTTSVQEALNAAAGLGLKAQVPAFNQDRLDGIINRVSSEASFDGVAWILREPAVNFSQSIVDDSVRANAEFQSGAGLRPKIVRTLRGKACDWCRALAGSYDMDELPDDIYRRHDSCRCTVELVSADGRRETIHSGAEGKRRYVKDKYGGYELTQEAKAAHRREMEATAAERARAARKKRIATWAKKRQAGLATAEERAKIEARKFVGLEVNGTQINSISDHVIHRMSERSISSDDILDAISHPLKIGDIKIDSEGRPSFSIIGKKATLYINSETGVMTTTHATHSKTAKKLKMIKEKRGEPV